MEYHKGGNKSSLILFFFFGLIHNLYLFRTEINKSWNMERNVSFLLNYNSVGNIYLFSPFLFPFALPLLSKREIFSSRYCSERYWFRIPSCITIYRIWTVQELLLNSLQELMQGDAWSYSGWGKAGSFMHGDLAQFLFANYCNDSSTDLGREGKTLPECSHPLFCFAENFLSDHKLFCVSFSVWLNEKCMPGHGSGHWSPHLSYENMSGWISIWLECPE